MGIARSSHRRCFIKEDVLKNFAKFTGKHLCQSLFVNKIAGLRPQACNFIKKRLLHRHFSENFAKFSRTLFLQNKPNATASVELWKRTHCCLKACWNRNKCFRNIKVAAVFGMAQSYLIYENVSCKNISFLFRIIVRWSV